jgi:ABC-type antimicrobial peptide transport system permease subunit
MSLFVRTAGEPTSLTRPLQALVRDLAPDLGIMQMGVLHDRMGSSLRDTLAVARLGGVFGILAVVLAAIGLYGVVSHVASSRTREIGVRMALGARSADVLALFLRQGGKLAAAGMVLGFLLTLAASGAIASFLYGVSATDPSTLLIIATAVLLIAMLATVLPALRASRVDPVASLRRE